MGILSSVSKLVTVASGLDPSIMGILSARLAKLKFIMAKLLMKNEGFTL
jgi:hypothetical protein